MICIFIASKFEDVNNLRMKNLLTDIGHKKFDKKEIQIIE